MTEISNLPRDLIEEIISRVPLKLMKAVRSTCKSWNFLTKRESFTKMHIDKVKAREGEEAMAIARMGQNLYLMSVAFDHVDPSKEIKGKLSNQEVNETRILHYEGLLLCILDNVNKVVVWNPYLGQTRRIDLRFSYALGYEYKESGLSLKLLRFLDYFWIESEQQFFWYEIYDFDSGLWTTLDVTPHWVILRPDRSVSLTGLLIREIIQSRAATSRWTHEQ